MTGSGLPGVHAAPGGDPEADEETMWPGTDTGAATGQPGAAPPSAAERACQQQRQALSYRQRPHPAVEEGHPRSGDGNLLCPAQLPGAPHTLAADDLIGINSGVPHAPTPRARSPRPAPARVSRDTSAAPPPLPRRGRLPPHPWRWRRRRSLPRGSWGAGVCAGDDAGSGTWSASHGRHAPGPQGAPAPREVGHESGCPWEVTFHAAWGGRLW